MGASQVVVGGFGGDLAPATSLIVGLDPMARAGLGDATSEGMSVAQMVVFTAFSEISLTATPRAGSELQRRRLTDDMAWCCACQMRRLASSPGLGDS